MFGFAKSVMNRHLAMQLAAAAGGVMAVSAQGAIVNWASAVSGTASTAARWNPAVVPVAADDLVFNATAGAQAFSVTFDATTATSRTMEFNQDTVTLNMSSPHTTTNGFTIADSATDVAVVTLSSGAWQSALSSSIAFNIGNVSGSVGTLNVTDDSADLILTGLGSRIRVGNNGTGTLSITGGGRVEVGSVILASGVAASNGTLTVSGAQAVSPFQRSTLDCTRATDTMSIGSGNDATATISNGALATLAGSLEIARSVSSTATLTIGGSGGLGGIHDATMDVAGSAFVGANDTAGLFGGTGTVTVNNNGLFSVGGTLNVGADADGSGTGTLNINSGGLVEAADVIDGPGGTINHTGGTLRINGGTYTGHAVPLVVSGTGSPTLQYSGNSVNNLTAAGGVGLRVGDDLGVGTFTGNLIIDSGADVVMSGLNNDINIGDDAGTIGVITVTGAGSRLVDNQPGDLIRVGVNGDGELRVESGGQVLATEIQVPASSLNGSGTIFTTGTSPVITTANLAVGNDTGGAGVVTLNPSSVINATDPGIGVLIRTTGSMIVTAGANLNATGTVYVDGGTLTVGGTVQAGTLVDIDTGGLLQSNNSGGTPLVDAPVHVRSGGEVEAIFEDLTMGDSTSPNGVILNSGSTVTIGAGRTLTFLDSNNTVAEGDIVMSGGTIVSNHFLFMDGGTANDTLSGFGTIDSDIVLSRFGVTAPSGTGLVFEETVDTPAAACSIAGTAIRFGPNSTFREFNAGHVFNCKVTADAGSVMRSSTFNTGAFGPITMGDGTITGVTLDGVLHMGTNGSLTLNDLNGVALGTLTDMNGGIITSVNGLSVSSGRVLRGRGTINANNPGANGFTVVSGGTIDPDDYFSTTDTYHGVGHFSIDGRYTQQAGGMYLCEIAGFNNEFQALNDRISCGPAVLNGTLEVSLIDGYEPLLCHEFTIMNYTSRTGTWTNIVSPPGVGVGVRYEATRAVLFFNSLECNDIDFNNDGSIFDPIDIDAFLSVYSEGPCIPTGATCDDIDFNNDCSVFDPADIDSFLSVYSEGPCHV